MCVYVCCSGLKFYNLPYHTRANLYSFFIDKCSSYHGRNLLFPGLISPKVLFTFTPIQRNSLICSQQLFLALVHSISWYRTPYFQKNTQFLTIFMCIVCHKKAQLIYSCSRKRSANTCLHFSLKNSKLTLTPLIIDYEKNLIVFRKFIFEWVQVFCLLYYLKYRRQAACL